jgi:hypothetical protein
MVAVLALEQAACLDGGVALGMTALRKDELERPALPEQRLGALRLAAVGGEEIRHDQPLLELHSVLGHGSAPRGCTHYQYAPPGGSNHLLRLVGNHEAP